MKLRAKDYIIYQKPKVFSVCVGKGQIWEIVWARNGLICISRQDVVLYITEDDMRRNYKAVS